MKTVVTICEKAAKRLVRLDYEKGKPSSCKQLIFPNKKQKRGNIKRVSEQELRLLFIEEFKKSGEEDLFYSIETPTEKKYIFGSSRALSFLRCNNSGQSASIDMCVFERNNNYRRLLNIEFKHKNVPLRNIGKDILKLICEDQNGAYIHLLKNTNNQTLCNNNKTGIFDKLYTSFYTFNRQWSNNNKFIQIVIISVDQRLLIHRKITRNDFKFLTNIFFQSHGCNNIIGISSNGWRKNRI